MEAKRSSRISAGIMAAMLLSLMYSFGTFGFLNLFGARTVVQLFILLIMTLLLFVMHVRVSRRHFFLVVLFSATYATGSLLYGGAVARLVDMFVLAFCLILFFDTPQKHVLFFAKALVIATTFLCSLITLAFVYYQIYPQAIHDANFALYHSDVGSQRIIPGHWLDFISFTSGEGFNINGHMITRLKGYSNEPSSTVVHYLAPAGVAFILGGRFTYLGVFILAVNVVAIGSLTSLIIVLISVGLFGVRLFRGALGKALFILIILSFLFIITNPEFVWAGFRYFSALSMDYAGLDLISRKLGEGPEDSNLGSRHQGVMDGIKLAFVSPLGYPQSMLGPGAGLIYTVSSSSGWIGLFIFGLFIISFLKNVITAYFSKYTSIQMYGLALVASLVFISLFVSGYGWERPPGIVVLLLYFRLLHDMATNRKSYRYPV